MNAEMLLFWETYSEFNTTEDIVNSSFNPIQSYEEELIEGPMIDIGCGQTSLFIKYSSTGRELFAIDNEQYQREKLKERISEYSGDTDGKVHFLNLSVPDDHLPKAIFSLVIVSNLLHFFDISDCEKILKQIKERTTSGSLIYVEVHSDNTLANKPENPENNSYFKHYFNQEDLDTLFDEASFERVYAAHIHSDLTKKSKGVLSKWLDKSLPSQGLKDAKLIAAIKDKYFRDNKTSSNLNCIYRRK